MTTTARPRQMTQAEKHALSAGDRFMNARDGRTATVTHAYSENGRRCAFVRWDNAPDAYAGTWSLGAMDLWTTDKPEPTR